MRAWTRSACVVLAWSILPVILVAIGMTGSVHLAQASTRTASSTEVILTSNPCVVAAPAAATSHTTRYVVRDGDSLFAIAARFAVRGGWPALYAANRQAIGPDPNLIRAGTVLVVPGRRAPVRYTVEPGDTLSGIAARFAVRGGWPALYAANRRVIGRDPNMIRAGAVLMVSRPAAPSAAARPIPPPSPPAGTGHHPSPGGTGAPAASVRPQWLRTMLFAVGPVILSLFLAWAVLAMRRRRQLAAGPDFQLGKVGIARGRGRGGRSRGIAAAVRPVAAAARVHPMGVAVPCAVLATGVVLFTFVTSAAVPVVAPPTRSGPASVYEARTGQPHHRLQPRQPGAPCQPALPSSPGQNAGSLPGCLEQTASPLSAPAALAPAGPGRAPGASRSPSTHLPGGGLVCDARQAPGLRPRRWPGAGG